MVSPDPNEPFTQPALLADQTRDGENFLRRYLQTPFSAKGRGDADQREVSVGKALLSGAVKWATYMARMAYQKMQNAVLTTSRVFENDGLVCKS
jgi:hypothetical protein